MSRPKPGKPAPDPPNPRPDARAEREAERARWREALQLLPLAEEAAGQPGTYLRVLFRPTFHPPACLTLHLPPQGGTVEVILPGPAVADWVRQAHRAPDDAPPLPALAAAYWATAPVPAAVREAFQDAIAGLALTGLGDTQAGTGRDGLLVDGEVVVDGLAAPFAAWSPTAAAAPAVYAVCRALLTLGRACLPDPPPQTGLGQIQGYLHER